MLERSYVKIDKKWVPWNNESMEFLNIEEDGWIGYDIVTFKYNNETYQSVILNK